MKIFVTGSTGMVGRNVCEKLDDTVNEVIQTTSRELDLTDYGDVFMFINKNNPKMIIHCAGHVGGIQANIKYPANYLVENLVMGMNLVIAAKEHGVPYLINLGSSCMYPRNSEVPLKENMLLSGSLEPTNEGYAIAKIAVARLCEYITKEHPWLYYKTLIPCNLYGKWDKFEEHNSHMIPGVIKKIYEAHINNSPSVEIWGDGSARRESMCAEDLAEFIVNNINSLEKLPDVLNVGPGYDFSINEYYQTIADVIGYKGYFTHDLSRPVGMKQKLLDISLLKETGWHPKTYLADGIKKTVDFYKTQGRLV